MRGNSYWNPRTIAGAAMVAVFLLAGLFPHWVTPYGPFQSDVWHSWDLSIPPFPPSKLHWLGTDDHGRDTYTQLVYGIIPTLRDASLLVLLTMTAAFVTAVITTLYRPRVIRFVLDTVTHAMTLVPPVVLAILTLEIPPIYFSPHSAWWYYGVIAVLETARFTRVVEGDIRLVAQKPFVEGAITAGNSHFRIFRVHMLRWLWPFLLEYIPAQYARILTVIGELAYFGLFSNVQLLQGEDTIHVETTELDWPAMIGTGGHNWFSSPGVVFFTTLAFCVLILAFRLLTAGIAQGSRYEARYYAPKAAMARLPSLMRAYRRDHRRDFPVEG